MAAPGQPAEQQRLPVNGQNHQDNGAHARPLNPVSSSTMTATRRESRFQEIFDLDETLAPPPEVYLHSGSSSTLFSAPECVAQSPASSSQETFQSVRSRFKLKRARQEKSKLGAEIDEGQADGNGQKGAAATGTVTITPQETDNSSIQDEDDFVTDRNFTQRGSRVVTFRALGPNSEPFMSITRRRPEAVGAAIANPSRDAQTSNKNRKPLNTHEPTTRCSGLNCQNIKCRDWAHPQLKRVPADICHYFHKRYKNLKSKSASAKRPKDSWTACESVGRDLEHLDRLTFCPRSGEWLSGKSWGWTGPRPRTDQHVLAAN